MSERKFIIHREEFPAIFYFDGEFFQEEYDIDNMRDLWVRISPDDAQRWLKQDGKDPLERRPTYGLDWSQNTEKCTCRGGPHGGYTCPSCRGVERPQARPDTDG